MKIGFLATSVALFSFAGLVTAQAPATGSSSPKSEPPRLLDCVQLGRPQPLRESPKPPALPTSISLAPSGPASPLANCCAAASCYWEEFRALGETTYEPRGRVWASAEYLLWWIEGQRVPPLVTTGPVESAGVLGAPGTTVLFGGKDVEDDAHSGGRFSIGTWLNECQTIGLEASYFFLGTRGTEFTAGGSGLPGSPVIARPTVNGITGGETAELVNFPGAESGTIHVSTSSRLQGVEVNALGNICCACCYSIDLLGGFRYLELREGIGIAENILVNPSVPTIGGTTFSVMDQFDTRNQFYGGQLGVRAEYRWGKLFADLAGGAALGTNHEEIDIHGTTVITPPGGPRTTLAGGILALPTNSGHFSRDRFAVVPELDVLIGYQVTPRIRVFVGYGLLYGINFARPGDIIDRTVNLTQIPSTAGPGTLVGPARPALVLRDTSFWAQGVSLGVEVRY